LANLTPRGFLAIVLGDFFFLKKKKIGLKPAYICRRSCGEALVSYWCKKEMF